MSGRGARGRAQIGEEGETVHELLGSYGEGDRAPT